MRPPDFFPYTIVLGDLVLHDLDTVAVRLGKRRSRVEALVRDGDLAAVMHGGRWMVAEEELVRFERSWTPPLRGARPGTSRRHRPPSRPAPATQAS